MRSTARLAYGAASRVSIPGGVRVAAGDRQREVGAGDAVEQPPMRLAEELPLRGVGADRGRGRLVDLDQRTARRGQLAEDAR